MHVIIENTVALNTGDAAILVAIIDIIQETFGAGTRFSVFDSAPEVAAQYYPEIEFYPLTTAFLSGHVRLFGRQRKPPVQRLLSRAQRAAFRRAVDDSVAGREVRRSVFLDRRVKRTSLSICRPI